MMRQERNLISGLKLGIIIIGILLVLSGCSSGALNIGNQNPDYFLIKDYYGQTHQDAVNETKDNLNIKEIDIYSSQQEAGTIINQSPYAGKEVFADSEITLYISNGECPDGYALDGLDYSRAEEILMQAGTEYSVEHVYNLNVAQGQVFGLGQNGDEYILYVSLGQPELNVSGTPGYAAKSGDFVFYTDDEYIYRMNADGTSKQTIVDASSEKEIIPYDSWIVYQNIQSNILYITNWQDSNKSAWIPNVNFVFKVIDDMVYFEDDTALKKYSLMSGNIYIVEKFENDSSISDVIYKRNDLYCVYLRKNNDDEYIRSLVRLNCFTGERVILEEILKVDELYFDSHNIYIYNLDGMYLLDESKMKTRQVAGPISGSVYAVYNNSIVYKSYKKDLIYSFNMITGQNTELCDYKDLLWIDTENDWIYYIKDNATYRKRSGGLEEEFFCETLILSRYYTNLNYDGIPSIDGWLYFFDSDDYLSRINIETKEIEQVADKPTEMPWWAKI